MDVLTRPPPRVLYVVTEDWYFISHRLPMARAARAAGYDVHVATNVGEDGDAIRSEGFTLHALRFARGKLAPLRSLRTVAALRKIRRAVAPVLVHHVAVQASALGVVAATGQSGANVYALTGLGHAFIAASGRARLLRGVVPRLLRRGINRPHAVGLVQNPDDQDLLMQIGVNPAHIVIIPGSGIDCDRFRPIPEPDGPVTFAFVGRMLDDKGVRTLLAAFKIMRATNRDCRLLLAGSPDPANPGSIPQLDVASWGREPGVNWLGEVDDIAGLWQRAHVAVLPSRREGLPKSLLEAAACGRPLIATDVPGCREITLHEKTGLLVPVDDPAALAAAMERLARSSQQRIRLGVAARRLVDERFSADLIGKATVDLYRRLIDS
ncbi:MAG: glycosyltransferase family 4 protein [Xanthobacteraceae bacterium]|nr:glycosyltransferase family 4 protein [Xanthobacteraceae bacterium]